MHINVDIPIKINVVLGIQIVVGKNLVRITKSFYKNNVHTSGGPRIFFFVGGGSPKKPLSFSNFMIKIFKNGP